MMRKLLFCMTFSLGFLAACGGTETDTQNLNTDTNTRETRFSCCINGAFYTCPNQAALDRCGNFSAPDPSSCTRGTGSCGNTNNNTNNNNTNNNNTGKAALGATCETNTECQSNACLTTNGATYGYCTITCNDFTDCPDFWFCRNVGNASSRYCQQ